MIETPNLILRPHRLEDFEPWFAMYGDEELFRFIGVPKLSREDAWNRLLRYAGHWSLLGYGLFAVLDRTSGAFLGEVGLADFHRGLGDEFDPFPEGAWIMARATHGRGRWRRRMTGSTGPAPPPAPCASSIRKIPPRCGWPASSVTASSTALPTRTGSA